MICVFFTLLLASELPSEVRDRPRKAPPIRDSEETATESTENLLQEEIPQEKGSKQVCVAACLRAKSKEKESLLRQEIEDQEMQGQQENQIIFYEGAKVCTKLAHVTRDCSVAIANHVPEIKTSLDIIGKVLYKKFRAFKQGMYWEGFACICGLRTIRYFIDSSPVHAPFLVRKAAQVICPLAILYHTGLPFEEKFACKRFKELHQESRNYTLSFLLLQSLLNPSKLGFCFDILNYASQHQLSLLNEIENEFGNMSKAHTCLGALTFGFSLTDFYTSLIHGKKCAFLSIFWHWSSFIAHFVRNVNKPESLFCSTPHYQISYIWMQQASRIGLPGIIPMVTVLNSIQTVDVLASFCDDEDA